MINNKVFNLIVGIALTMAVLGCVPGLPSYSVSQELAGKFVIIVLIALFFIKNIWLQMFLLWCVARVVIFPLPSGATTLYTVTFYLIFMQILSNNLNKERINSLLNIICVIAIIQFIVMLLQYCGIWIGIIPLNSGQNYSWDMTLFDKSKFPIHITFNNAKNFHKSITGFTGNINFASSLMGLCFPAFLRKRWAWFIPIVLLGIYFSRSFQGAVIVAFVFCIFVYMKLGLKKASIIIGTILILLISIALISGELKDYTLSSRTLIWKFYIQKVIPKRPIIGWGLGQSQYLWYLASREIGQNVAWLHPHNEFINSWAELGVIGFGLVMGYLITSLYTAFKLFKNKFVILGIIAGLLSCSINFTAHLTIGIIFLVYLSMLQYLNKGE